MEAGSEEPISRAEIQQSAPVLGSAAAGTLASAAYPARRLEETERRVGFLESVIRAKDAVENAAREDDRTVAAPYREMNLAQLGSALEQAERSIAEEAETLEKAESGMLHGDLARFQRIYSNARDQAAAGAALVREEAQAQTQNSFQPVSLLPSLFQRSGVGGDFSPLKATQRIAEFFGFTPAAAPENQSNARAENTRAATATSASASERLTQRIVLLNGLPAAQRNQTLRRLNLAEPTRLTLPGGEVREVSILHNGYIMGGGKTGLDCSSLVSSTLPEDVRNARLTTLDLRSIWVYRWTGRLPAPPQYELEQSKKLKDVAWAFDAIDIYAGAPVEPGDLIVYRTLWQATGHVFIVRNFDKATLTATVLEAAQSGAGTLRERSFPLSSDPLHAKQRHIRAGLYLLRVRPKRQTVCRYDSRRNSEVNATEGAPPRGGAR